MTGKQISIGRIIKVHGISGEVKVDLRLPSNFDFAELEGAELFLSNKEKKQKSYFVEQIFAVNKGFLIKFKGINSSEQAEEIKLWEIFFDKAKFKELPQNEFFIEDLAGLKIVDASSSALVGTLQEYIENPANDLLKIRQAELEKFFLLPFVDEFIQEVDLQNKQIKVKDWQIFAE
jgi:16S rRNA processing protein RimM